MLVFRKADRRRVRTLTLKKPSLVGPISLHYFHPNDSLRLLSIQFLFPFTYTSRQTQTTYIHTQKHHTLRVLFAFLCWKEDVSFSFYFAIQVWSSIVIVHEKGVFVLFFWNFSKTAETLLLKKKLNKTMAFRFSKKRYWVNIEKIIFWEMIIILKDFQTKKTMKNKIHSKKKPIKKELLFFLGGRIWGLQKLELSI